MDDQLSLSLPTLQRICVIGTTGCGKSTLADKLAHTLNLPHVELDSLHWQPGWKEADRAITRTRVSEIAHADAWVIDGNYSFLRDILWTRAQALVWLDYPLSTIFWRLWWRTWKRVITKEVLWGTNRERLAEQFISKESLFLWALKTNPKQKKLYASLPYQPEYAHLKVFHLKNQKETNRLLVSLVTSFTNDPIPLRAI